MLKNTHSHRDLMKKETRSYSKNYHDLNFNYTNTVVSISVLAVFLLFVLFNI